MSSDRDEASFDSYYAEMPFYALPFSARDEAASLGEKCAAHSTICAPPTATLPTLPRPAPARGASVLVGPPLRPTALCPTAGC